VRRFTLSHNVGHRVAPGRNHQFLELTRVFPLGFTGKIEVNENGSLTHLGAFKKQCNLGK
jgi:hypothetical protein